MNPAHDDGDVRIWHGDAIDGLRAMPAETAQTCITSPPFWGLRDYGVAGQIGLEPTPDQWAARLVDVFREVRRVLRPDGTLWLECGDTYIAGQGGRQSSVGEMPGKQLQQDGGIGTGDAGSWQSGATAKTTPPRGITDLKPKDLTGAPWLLAFALRNDGWYLRSDVIWSRPNPMPESVTDRPTKAHSYLFLLSKAPRYYYDADAIREPAENDPSAGGRQRAMRNGDNRYTALESPDPWQRTGGTFNGANGDPNSRNARSVWTIPTEGTPYAHFATFPQELVRRCILAGTSDRGACPTCGAPWARQVERSIEHTQRVHDVAGPAQGVGRSQAAARSADGHVSGITRVETTGWTPSCTCPQILNDDDAPILAPQRVLDPFMGSGTTALVARSLGRHALGCELSSDYLAIARRRLQQLSLLA